MAGVISLAALAQVFPSRAKVQYISGLIAVANQEGGSAS
jgi:hypothetical protein